MKKNIYRTINVKSINVAKLHESVKDQRIVFGIDVAKEVPFGVFMNERSEVLLTIKWTHPRETMQVIDLVSSLPSSSVEVALEPSGTYGDSLRYQFMKRQIAVYRINTKKSHDYCEVYDGVPSSHDAKSAAIISTLHLQGVSDIWREYSDTEKQLRAAVRIHTIYSEECFRHLSRLEALLSRHWPEVMGWMDLQSASLLELLREFGSPQEVSREPEKARNLLRRVGCHFLKQAKIDGVIESAATTIGLPPIEEERHALMIVAGEVRRSSKEAHKAKGKIEDLSQEHATIGEMSKAVGKVTAAVIYAYTGDPAHYPCASAFVKKCGLNLKERSSGKYKGLLKITKRGPSILRKYIYMAVLRCLKDNVIFQKWYERKVKRDGGKKGRAIVALMRKLTKALWYVGQGNEFDPRYLFDMNRLKLKDSEVIYD